MNRYSRRLLLLQKRLRQVGEHDVCHLHSVALDEGEWRQRAKFARTNAFSVNEASLHNDLELSSTSVPCR
jgi:hypothetical protein